MGPKIYKAATAEAAELRRNTAVIILGKGKRSKGLSGSHGDEGEVTQLRDLAQPDLTRRVALDCAATPTLRNIEVNPLPGRN